MNMKRIGTRAQVAALGAAVLVAAILTGNVRAVGAPVQPRFACAQQPDGTALPGTYVTPAGRVPGGYAVALPTTAGQQASTISPCDVSQLDDAYRAAGIVGMYVTPTRNVSGAYGVALPIVAGLNDARGLGRIVTIDISKYLPSRTPTAPGYLSSERTVGPIRVPLSAGLATATRVRR
jgi:hypothetical protein